MRRKIKAKKENRFIDIPRVFFINGPMIVKGLPTLESNDPSSTIRFKYVNAKMLDKMNVYDVIHDDTHFNITEILKI